jgi:uncharacterized UPF0160 family protein
VVHSFNPSTQEYEQEDCKFKASLDYTAKLLSHKTNKKQKQLQKQIQKTIAIPYYLENFSTSFHFILGNPIEI